MNCRYMRFYVIFVVVFMIIVKLEVFLVVKVNCLEDFVRYFFFWIEMDWLVGCIFNGVIGM